MRNRHVPLFIPLLVAAPPQDEIKSAAPAASKIVERWQKQDPVAAERKLHIVYWTPADREPAPRHRERLSPIMRHIRNYYSKEMKRMGFGPLTFSLDEEADGMVKIHDIKGRFPYSHYGPKSGYEIRDECAPILKQNGIDVATETVVLFCNMANWDPQSRTITQNSPYYAGGTNRKGFAWQVDSPILNLDDLDNTGDYVNDGQYKHISLGRYNSIFIGGIAHELGHALGLPHNKECAAEREAFGTALMGSGNRSYGEQLRNESKGSFITLAHGLRLLTHPLFCGSIKGWDAPSTAKPSQLTAMADGKNLIVSGKVTADVPVYAVVAYADPEGRRDYDATTATAVPDKNGIFTLTCTDLVPGKKGELRVCFLQANGVASAFIGAPPTTYDYSVAEDGTLDLSAIQDKLRKEGNDVR